MNRPESVSLPSPYFREEHEALRAQIRRFVENEIKPHGLKWEEQGYVPREVLRRMGELGFLGIRYPAEYGGSEMDTLGSIVLGEELGRSTFGGAAITILVHTDMASVHMANGGSPAQKARWMPEIVAGRAITAVAVTEPDAGSDVKAIRTTARRDGEHYVLNGTKMFITNGVHADLYFIAAKTSPDARPSQQISMFMVEKGTPGFTVSRALDKHGWRSSDTAELSFQDCRIPAENLLGKEGRGFYAIMSNFQNERTVIGAMAMGEAQAALDLTHRLRHDAQGVRRNALREAGHPPAPRDARREGRGRAAARLSRGLPRRAGRRLHARSLDGEGLLRRVGQRSDVRLRAVPRRHGLHARVDDRAHGARRARADHRRRRDRSDARRSRQAAEALALDILVCGPISRNISCLRVLTSCTTLACRGRERP